MSVTKKSFAVCLVLLVAFACSRPSPGGHDVLGIRAGMPRDEALRRLEQLGTKERDERKQQEVWVLKDNPDYTHLLVGFNKEKTELRYVTGVARPGRVRYADVLDVQKARNTNVSNNLTYELEVPAADGRPAYSVSARGTDPQHLAYYSVEKKEADASPQPTPAP